MAVSFLTESTKDFVETKTVGGFCNGAGQNDFDGIFTEAYNGLMSKNIDIMRDINELIRNKAVLGAFLMSRYLQPFVSLKFYLSKT